MPHRAVAIIAILVLATATGCAPAARPGSLEPTLVLEDVDGASVAVQNGIPVPIFERQPRRQVDLTGPWRVERAVMDADLSLTARDESLEAIVAEANGREAVGYDDSAWEQLPVPGALNVPPDGDEIGGWYRRSFFVPDTWAGLSATLKFGSANYIADAWLNGEHLGYHEGGYTPFAFDVSRGLVPGELNLLAVRVDNPDWGSRNDIVPWGLADWWNYGGITGPVWIEATPPTHLVRADTVPHLDSVDVSVLLRRAEALADGTPTPVPSGSIGPAVPAEPTVRMEVLPASIGPENLASEVASALVEPGQAPLVSDELPLPDLEPGDIGHVDTGFLLGDAALWSPADPSLYVLHVEIVEGGTVRDELWTTFGLRHVAVESGTGRLLLNGEPTMFTGVGLHDEVIDPAGDGERASATRVHSTDVLLGQLDHAREVNADLIRTGHTPANPLLLMLADRLGYAVWEEIPLYHYTPLTYAIALDRGIPQQMLREMALRDMNRASVLFHGLSNESTGTDEREDALRLLHDVDREIDGTRLTGQAAYGSLPADPTHEPLDVAGYTFYYEVFYGTDAAAGTASALATAHALYPDKPIVALEFGRWADGDTGPQRQAQILRETFPVFERVGAGRGGYLGAAVWWTLEDFTTMVPGIAVEHFGLYRPSGERREAAATATRLFSGEGGTVADEPGSTPGRTEVVRELSGPDLRLLGYLAYGLAISLGSLGGLLLLLLRRGGRAAPR